MKCTVVFFANQKLAKGRNEIFIHCGLIMFKSKKLDQILFFIKSVNYEYKVTDKIDKLLYSLKLFEMLQYDWMRMFGSRNWLNSILFCNLFPFPFIYE